MERISRWMMAVLAALGLYTVAAEAQSAYSTPHPAATPGLAPLDQGGIGTTNSDGVGSP